MATDRDDVISTLNNLIETCKDGQEGFMTASNGVKNTELKALFQTYAQQRAQFAAELQAEVRRLGGDPEKSGSVAGTLHQGWMDIKAAVTGGDEGAIISECESGEDSTVKNYQDAINEGHLPADVRTIVERQYAQVKEAHDRIRALERASGAGA
jgi:uncharacterized protein (TIGR02284 family)